MFLRVAATSSAPSGAPCAAPVFAFFGAPFAMIVFRQMSVGFCDCALATTSARSMASASCPSTPGTPFQPYASNRFGVSSVNQLLMLPFSESMEMPLSS